MAKHTVTMTVRKKFKVKLTGDSEGVHEVLAAFLRGAMEMHVDEQGAAGRSRDEVVDEILNRIHIARVHHKLGESDGFQCDLSDA